jgi:hypothetical protein
MLTISKHKPILLVQGKFKLASETGFTPDTMWVQLLLSEEAIETLSHLGIVEIEKGVVEIEKGVVLLMGISKASFMDGIISIQLPIPIDKLDLIRSKVKETDWIC